MQHPFSWSENILQKIWLKYLVISSDKGTTFPSPFTETGIKGYSFQAEI